MQVLQNAQRPEGSLQEESSRKTGVLVYKSSWLTLSVTSRRGFFTSRRQNCISLPRRDVNFEALYHVATWIFHVATWNSHVATSLLHVATSFGHLLCHVATWDFNIATWACLLSVTSRREPARRDVTLFLAQEWFIFHLHRTPLFL